MEGEQEMPAVLLMEQGEGAGGGVAVEADVPEDQQDLAGAPFLPAMLEQYPHEHDLPAVLAMPPPAPPHQLLLRHASQSSLDESSTSTSSSVTTQTC